MSTNIRLLPIILLIPAIFSGCTALDNITAGNQTKVVTIAQETWGGKIVAELTSTAAILPNLTICFGKTSAYYNTTPAATPPELVTALAEHLQNSNSTISATATGISQSK
jgi:hypothetical protein